MRRYVDVHKLGPALLALKKCGHPQYSFVQEGADYLNKLTECDNDELSDDEDSSDVSSVISDVNENEIINNTNRIETLQANMVVVD